MITADDLTIEMIDAVWREASGTSLEDVDIDLMYDCNVARSQPYTGHELPTIQAARERIAAAINARKVPP